MPVRHATVAERSSHDATRADRESGTRLDPLLGCLVAGKFRIERVLASGGMGRVYVARQESLERRVALKVVLHDDESATEQEAQRRFRLEAEILARLRHPNIVTLHDFGDLEPTFTNRSYLAMELLEGQTLADRLESSGRLPPAELFALTEQMVRGLRFAHAIGVVHRDMKPSNLMLMPDIDGLGVPTLKILDFGTGKLLEPEGRGPARRRLTREGFVVGTPAYMAPEHLAGRPCQASDLFAVGIIMFECLTGVLPFDFGGVAQLRPPSPRLREVARDLVVPDIVEDLVARLLAPSPADRPTSTELLDELRRCALALEAGASKTRRLRLRARAAWITGAALLGVLGLACGAGLVGTSALAPPERAGKPGVPRTVKRIPRHAMVEVRGKDSSATEAADPPEVDEELAAAPPTVASTPVDPSVTARSSLRAAPAAHATVPQNAITGPPAASVVAAPPALPAIPKSVISVFDTEAP